jgi:hypothetical protein
VNRSGDRTATSSTCTAVDELQSGEENVRMLGRLSRLPGAGARRRAWERLERLAWPTRPPEDLGPARPNRWHPGRIHVLWSQPKLSVCGQRGMQMTAT